MAKLGVHKMQSVYFREKNENRFFVGVPPEIGLFPGKLSTRTDDETGLYSSEFSLCFRM